MKLKTALANRVGETYLNSLLRNDKLLIKQINGLKDRAFIHSLLIPAIMLSLLLLFGVVLWVFSLF